MTGLQLLLKFIYLHLCLFLMLLKILTNVCSAFRIKFSTCSSVKSGCEALFLINCDVMFLKRNIGFMF